MRTFEMDEHHWKKINERQWKMKDRSLYTKKHIHSAPNEQYKQDERKV